LSKTGFFRLFVYLALFLSATNGQVEAFSSSTPVRNAKLEKIASGLAASLEMRKPVQVIVVPENDRIVSVEPFLNGQGFRVEFEQAFFDQLNDEEIVAALAHEIGHVWIFSHPPHNHSEPLANEIALKIVPRKQMEALYIKLWKYLGTTGDMVDLLGAE